MNDRGSNNSTRRAAPRAGRRASPRRTGNRGLTLIEVVAALGIIAVGIVGILALFPTGLKQSGEAADRTTAAMLGEYVVDQVRLRQGDIKDTDATADALTTLDWGDYSHNGRNYTFDGDTDPVNLSGADAYGTGEQIVKQMPSPVNPNDLTDAEMYSRYEVTLKFDQVLSKDGNPNGAFNRPTGGESLKQVTVTIRWPRATTDDERAKQNTMTLVTFIRPQG